MSLEPLSSQLASPEPTVLRSQGIRVRVSTVDTLDITPYRRAVQVSGERLKRWNPVDPGDLAAHLTIQSRNHRTFIIHMLNPEGDHDIVGRVNVTNVVRGRFESAAMGYDSYDPYAGRGLFVEGLRLVLDLVFAPESDGGMGLHRVSASVQPGNHRSAGLLRSLGFQREGYSPRMLCLPGPDGMDTWRDQVTYVVLCDEWPPRPYPPPSDRKVVVLVNGAPGSGTRALARRLAGELAVPLFSMGVIQESAGAGRAAWALLADSPVGGVVESWFQPDDSSSVVEGLTRCGLDPARVPEVWCLGVGAGGGAEAEGAKSARPLGLGPTVEVDTGSEVGRAEIVRIALQVGEPLPGPPDPAVGR